MDVPKAALWLLGEDIYGLLCFNRQILQLHNCANLAWQQEGPGLFQYKYFSFSILISVQHSFNPWVSLQK